MIKILANDGIHPKGQELLETNGCKVDTIKIVQGDLPKELPAYDVIIVRSATKVRKELIDQCPNLKVIARAGVGLDNIDVDYAKSKGIAIYNTPGASSNAVAELVFGHFLTLSRFLQDANRQMPTQGDKTFKDLKKSYSKGSELKGKTLGIIGFGQIGTETIKKGLGLGMKIMAFDPYVEAKDVELDFFDGSKKTFEIKTSTMDEVLEQSDYISLHVPSLGQPLINKEEFAQMKDGVILVNASRGGIINEDDLIDALDSGKVMGCGLDVFMNEPTPKQSLLQHAKMSLTPHTGASTKEAQTNIGVELATKILAHFK